MKLLATHDPLAALAGADAEALTALLEQVNTEDAAVQELLDEIAAEAGIETTKREWVEYHVNRKPVILDSVVFGSYAACSWAWGYSDDYERFREWKQTPSIYPKRTDEMADDLAELIKLWARQWRGFVITVPPPGVSKGREYAAGFLGKGVATRLGVDFVTVFGDFPEEKRRHHPRASLERKKLPPVLVWPDMPIVLVDDGVSSGTTARLCIRALGDHPCWFFAWIRHNAKGS